MPSEAYHQTIIAPNQGIADPRAPAATPQENNDDQTPATNLIIPKWATKVEAWCDGVFQRATLADIDIGAMTFSPRILLWKVDDFTFPGVDADCRWTINPKLAYKIVVNFLSPAFFIVADPGGAAQNAGTVVARIRLKYFIQ